MTDPIRAMLGNPPVEYTGLPVPGQALHDPKLPTATGARRLGGNVKISGKPSSKHQTSFVFELKINGYTA